MKEINALVVDDLAEVRTIVKAVLKRMGAKGIYEATNGLEALRILAEKDESGKPISQDINVILCDINMPKMDGISFLREIRKSEEFNRVAVIMITGEGTKEKIVEAIKLGADSFIIKPYTLKTVEDKITKVLERKGAGMIRPQEP